MSATKKTDTKGALSKAVVSYHNMMTDGRLDGINCTQSINVDLSVVTSVFAGLDRRTGDVKKIDIAGAKGSAFTIALIEYLAKCYINHGVNHASIAAIRNYCDVYIPKFAKYYINFDQDDQLRTILPHVAVIANSFALSASDNKSEALLMAKYCCGFVHSLFVKSCFPHFTFLKQNSYPLIVKLLADDGLFDAAPELHTEMLKISADIFVAAPKGGAKGKKAVAQPTDGAAQNSIAQTTSLNCVVSEISTDNEFI